KTRQPIRHRIGKMETKFVSPNLKVRIVCGQCNNGWMSDLETKNIPLVGCLIQDFSTPLDISQQTSIAVWATKTGMVVDCVRPRSLFCSKQESEQLRLQSRIPENTVVWIGRYFGSALALYGTDIRLDMSAEVTKIGFGCVTTILVGHLIIQSLTIHK